MMLIVYLSIFFFLGYLSHKISDKDEYTSRDSFFKIVVSSFQVNGLAFSFAFSWGEVMGGFLAAQSRVSSIGTTYFDVRCLQSDPSSTNSGTMFVLSSVIYMLGPLFIGVLFSFLMLLRNYCLQRVFAAAVQDAKNAAAAALAVILYFLHPYLVTRFALVLSCVSLGFQADQLFMSEDLSCQCWTGRHLAYVLMLGLPLFLVYVIGVPLLLFRLLTGENGPLVKALAEINKQHFKSRSNVVSVTDPEILAKRNFIRESYGFLFLGYKPICVW